MIRIYTKLRHVKKIKNWLRSRGISNEIYTTWDKAPDTPFDLGISYCYPRKITPPELYEHTFINFHPAKLPKYKGYSCLKEAIRNNEMNWGVSLHFMDLDYDTGPIIETLAIPLHEPPASPSELGAISHYFLFELFKKYVR